MSIIPMLIKEMEQEAQTTCKMRPDNKFSWKPHENSMSIIATELLELFERSLAEGKAHNDNVLM